MLLEIIILITSIPVGYLLAHLCRDELVTGREWFKLISVISVVVAILLIIFYRNLAMILTLSYIAITNLVSLWKGYDKKWVKTR